MPDTSNNENYQIIWLIRRLFRSLSQRSNESLVQFGITSADRAVMEFLYPDKSLSVPEIAEQYKVSRQHIQATVNSLIDAGLAKTEPNPRHKRSPLIVLNNKGKKLFATILENDQEIVEALFASIPKNGVQATRRTLQSLLDQLS